jgi:PAS domain S-box-containing protein
MTSSADTIRVLHVDDDPGLRGVVGSALEREDDRFVVESAADAAAALDRLDDDDVDCIVSDYEMTGRNGVEFLKAVRESWPDLPFMLFTAKGSETVASEAISAGVTDYLQKGTDSSQYAVLANRVSNAVERYRSKRRADRLEREYRLVAETATDAFWTLDPDSGSIRMDGLRNFGYDGHEPDRQWWVRRLHPADRERVLEADASLLAGDDDVFDERLGDRGRFSIEYRWRRADGTYADCVERGVVLFEDGDPVRMVGTMTDVSERKATERELRRYERTVNSMREAACIYDEEGRFELVNEYLASFYGTNRDALEGERSNLIPKIRDEEGADDAYRALLDGDRTELTGEVETEFPGVGYEVLAYRLTPMVVDGGIEGVVGVAREVTDRKQREREIERTNALLSALFETLPVGVAVLDGDGRIRRANRRAETVLGLTKSEITDRTYNDPEWQIVDSDGEPVPDDDLPFARVMETGDPVFDYEHGIEWPDGSRRWVSVNAAPLTTDAAAAERVVTVITDVTDQREHERALERQNERLDEFASIVSHDLRSPLTVAMGGLELAREECDSEELDRVERAHERMTALIDDLLTLARDGPATIEATAVDLEAAVDTCWGRFDTEGAVLVVDTDRTVRADRNRFLQLLENVLRNAVEHGSTGNQPTDDDVTVTVGDLPDGFYVEDDGPGIPESDRDAVFDAGYSTTEAGVGFGLRIVERVAEAHGWTVRITDGTDGGARFEFTGVEFAD